MKRKTFSRWKVRRLRKSPRWYKREREGAAICRGCHKTCLWTFKGRYAYSTRKGRGKWAKDRRRLAVRCLDCLCVFCQKCARKHFAPRRRAERAVDREIARVAVRAMRAAGKELCR